MASASKSNTNSIQPDSVVMKSIKNYSVQGLYIILEGEDGGEHIWLEPKQIVRVPEARITQQIKNLHRRRIVQISN